MVCASRHCACTVAVCAKAAEEGVALFVSERPAFEVVGRLYQLGLRGDR